jgi:inosose dehydratase
MSQPLDRIATAPTSWGLCEVPGWGVQLPPERVLPEMRALGFDATEAGPDGYLGASADEIRALLQRYHLRLIGGFLPVVLHDLSARAGALASAARVAEHFRAAGASFLISAVVVDTTWTPPHALTGAEWNRVFDGLCRIDEIADAHGLTHVVHPHWGTLIERRADVWRVLEGCDARFCLDTGHLALGETDCVEFAATAGARVAHVHLKDIDEAIAARLRTNDLGLVPAVKAGLFRPLGEGDAPIAETVHALEAVGYEGWYVLEQDTSVASADPAAGEGPEEDVRRSAVYLRELLGGSAAR